MSIFKQFANLPHEGLAEVIGLNRIRKRGAVVSSDSVFVDSYGLSVCQIRIYILLHFYVDTRSGIATNINIRELSVRGKMNIKTAVSALEKLHLTGLIVCADNTDLHQDEFCTICICNYRSMFLRRGEGGKGYSSVDMEFLDELLSISGINNMRTFLRLYLEIQQKTFFGALKEASCVIRFDALRQGLPKYVKKGVLTNALKSIQSIIDCTFFGKKSFLASLNTKYQSSVIREKVKVNARTAVDQELQAMNSLILQTYSELTHDRKLKESTLNFWEDRGITFPVSLKTASLEHLDEASYLPLLSLNPEEKKDTYLLARDFGENAIIQAIRHLYGTYLLNGPLRIEKIGAMLRSILTEQAEKDALLTFAT